MAINFPTSLDSFTNPLGTQTLDTPDHAGQHSDANDAIEALEAKVGLGAGTPTVNKILVGSGNGTATWNTTWSSGTINNATIGTSQITGGTITTPLISGTATFNTAIAGSAIATGAEVTTGTDNTQIVTPLSLGNANLNTRLKSKIVSYTRDISAANGTVGYTGAGFTPSVVIAFGAIAGSDTTTTGFAASDGGMGELTQYQANTFVVNAKFLSFATSASDYEDATIASYTTDGVILTWTKTGSPTGTGAFYILYLS